MDQHTWDQSVATEFTRRLNAARARVAAEDAARGHQHDCGDDILDTEYDFGRNGDPDDFQYRQLECCECGAERWTEWRSPRTPTEQDNCAEAYADALAAAAEGNQGDGPDD